MNQPSPCGRSQTYLSAVLRGRPQAIAVVMGSESHPALWGTVRFYQTPQGAVVYAEIRGLPQGEKPCRERIFGFHIHTGGDCGSSTGEPFSDAMSHYDPNDCEHPYHAGDLPPLFGSGGVALCACLTDRFSVEEVIGRTVIIHDHPDDLSTQPSGNSGTKIACGVIRRHTAGARL